MLRSNRLLNIVTVLMMAVLAANLVGLAVDTRIITGSPAWLKPAKFALSTLLYTGTLAWILSKISIWPRFLKVLADLTAVSLLIEISIINLQALRGTTSHFNVTTILDSALFALMGIFIGLLSLASVGITVALFRQHFTNRSFGWSLRLGLLLTVIGSISGGLMVRAAAGHPAGIIGAHTVGAPDGGAGLPGTNWSTGHGDLRIPHFVGLHGMQVIPLLYWLLSRKERPRSVTITIAATSYLGVILILSWQALRGQAVLQPDSETLVAWATWLSVSVGALALSELLDRQSRGPVAVGVV